VEIARQISAVTFVFALLGAAIWSLRRGGSVWGPGSSLRLGRTIGSSRARALESIERLALTPQHSLHLVRIGGREVVVATFPQGCALLTERGQAQGAGQ
jgi:flagellar biogenesis protein FliO